MTIRFNDASDGHRIAAASGVSFNPTVDACIGRVTPEGKLMGGVLYQGYTGRSIGAHIASFHAAWVNKDMLWVCFHYPFVQLKCQKIFGQVPENNSRALEFDKKLGFKEEARIKDVFPDGDMILLSMYRDDCRWLKIEPRTLRSPRHGWEILGTSTA